MGRAGGGLIELKPVHTSSAYWLSRGFRPRRTLMAKTIEALLSWFVHGKLAMICRQTNGQEMTHDVLLGAPHHRNRSPVKPLVKDQLVHKFLRCRAIRRSNSLRHVLFSVFTLAAGLSTADHGAKRRQKHLFQKQLSFSLYFPLVRYLSLSFSLPLALPLPSSSASSPFLLLFFLYLFSRPTHSSNSFRCKGSRDQHAEPHPLKVSLQYCAGQHVSESIV